MTHTRYKNCGHKGAHGHTQGTRALSLWKSESGLTGRGLRNSFRAIAQPSLHLFVALTLIFLSDTHATTHAHTTHTHSRVFPLPPTVASGFHQWFDFPRRKPISSAGKEMGRSRERKARREGGRRGGRKEGIWNR